MAYRQPLRDSFAPAPPVAKPRVMSSSPMVSPLANKTASAPVQQSFSVPRSVSGDTTRTPAAPSGGSGETGQAAGKPGEAKVDPRDLTSGMHTEEPTDPTKVKANSDGSFLNDAINYGKGVLRDATSTDNASAPVPQSGWWGPSAAGTAERQSAIDDYQGAAAAGAVNIRNQGDVMADAGKGIGADAAAEMDQAGRTATRIGDNAQIVSYGTAGDLGEAADTAFGRDSPNFDYSGAAVGGQYDAARGLRDRGGLGDVNEVIADTDFGAGLGTARGLTEGAVSRFQEEGNPETDALSRFQSGAGPSPISNEAQQNLADFEADESGRDALANFRAGDLGYQDLRRANIGTVQPGRVATAGTSGLGELGNRLMNFEGPSAAEQQMQLALSRNTASQMALANSGRGAYNGQAQRQAQATAASMGQETAAQMGILRSQEEDARNQLAASIFSSQGDLGNQQDILRQQSEAQRLQQLSEVAEQEQARSATNLSAIQSSADVGLGIDQTNLDAAGKSSAAAIANDQARLAARDQELRAQIAAAQAAGQDTSNLVALLNANTQAAQAESAADLGGADLLSRSVGQNDSNAIGRNQALGEVSRGITEGELAAESANQENAQAWFGAGVGATQAGAEVADAGFGRQLEGAGMGIDAAGTGATLNTQAQLDTLAAQMGGVINAEGMIVDAAGNVLADTSEWFTSEADRKAGLYGTYIPASAGVSQANSALDAKTDYERTQIFGRIFGGIV